MLMFGAVIDIGFLKSIKFVAITVPSSNCVSLLPVRSDYFNFISKIQDPILV